VEGVAGEGADEIEAQQGTVYLPERSVHPLRQIGRRLWYALAIMLIVFLLVLLDSDGYKDANNEQLNWVGALYYTTVTLSTTGYGDIVPESDRARLVNVLVITPLRVAFLAILVGTTFEVLTRRTRDQLRRNRWRSKMSGHTIVVGYGTKGCTAVRTLIAQGADKDDFVIVEQRTDLAGEANRDGLASIVGDATRSVVLRMARVDTANRVIVATNRDDSAVLIALTVRQLNKSCTVVASIREAENEPLLLQSGVDAVITSSEAAGRLLGMAAQSPAISEVFNDLLIHGEGLDLVQRPVRPDEVGKTPGECEAPVIAVLRGNHAFPYGQVQQLREGDRLVLITSP